MPTTQDRGRVRLGVFVLLLAGARLLFLLAGLDPEEERVVSYFDAAETSWARGPERPLYDREELYTGAAAELMRIGSPLPARAYQFMPYGSGSLVVAQLARPIFGLLGSTYLAFKLLPMLVTVLGGVCWCGVARLWLGSRGALWFAALYLLAPSVFVRTALIAKGDHAEAMAWIGLTVWLASSAGFAGSERARNRLAGLAGLAAGLGVALTYSTVPVVGALGGLAAARSRLRPRRAWIWAVAGVLVGLVPWIVIATSTGAGAVRVYSRPLGALLPPAEILDRLLRVLRSGLFASYDLPLVARPGAGWIWLASVVAAWVFLGTRVRPVPGRTFLAVGTAAHLLAFVAAAPDASSRYLVPAYPLFLLALAAAAAGGPAAGIGADLAASRWSRWLPAPALALGLASQLVVLGGSHWPGLGAPRRGYDWPLLGEVLGTKLTAEGVRSLPERVRPFVWVGVGRRIARQDPARWPEEAVCAGEESQFVWEGIGVGAIESGRWRSAATVLPRLPERERAALRRGLWRYGEVLFAPLLLRGTPDAIRESVASFAPADQPECRRALARTLAVLAAHGASLPGPAVACAHRLLDAGERAEGAGWALFRSVSPRGILWWRLPRGEAVDCAYEARLGFPAVRQGRPADTDEFWRGAAAAWGASLATLEPGRLLSDRRSVERRLEEAAWATKGLPDAAASEFYRALGSAVAAAWRDPAREGRPTMDLERWSERLPAAQRSAFQDGLRAAGLEVGG